MRTSQESQDHWQQPPGRQKPTVQTQSPEAYPRPSLWPGQRRRSKVMQCKCLFRCAMAKAASPWWLSWSTSVPESSRQRRQSSWPNSVAWCSGVRVCLCGQQNLQNLQDRGEQNLQNLQDASMRGVVRLMSALSTTARRCSKNQFGSPDLCHEEPQPAEEVEAPDYDDWHGWTVVAASEGSPLLLSRGATNLAVAPARIAGPDAGGLEGGMR